MFDIFSKTLHLYSTGFQGVPPAEKLDHVARFELTSGCSYRKCSYCDLYDKGFRVKTKEQFEKHVDDVFEELKQHEGVVNNLTRIYIGSGNALALKPNNLAERVKYVADRFKDETSSPPKRISLQGRVSNVSSQASMSEIATAGTGRFSFDYTTGVNLIYLGLESGSDEVLDYVNKGHTREMVVKASEKMSIAGIDTSVMIMIGLGGKRLYEKHAAETSDMLNRIKPKFITFMGINPSENSQYFQIMKSEIEAGTNRPLTDWEMQAQLYGILHKIGGRFETSVGCFEDDIDPVGNNPMTFGSVKLEKYKSTIPDDFFAQLKLTEEDGTIINCVSPPKGKPIRFDNGLRFG